MTQHFQRNKANQISPKRRSRAITEEPIKAKEEEKSSSRKVRDGCITPKGYYTDILVGYIKGKKTGVQNNINYNLHEPDLNELTPRTRAPVGPLRKRSHEDTDSIPSERMEPKRIIPELNAHSVKMLKIGLNKSRKNNKNNGMLVTRSVN